MDGDTFDKTINNIVKGAMRLSGAGTNPTISSDQVDKRNELKCIELYKNGWQQDGFERVPDSEDIIVYWKKEEVEKRISVYLTFRQQARWVRLLEEKIKSGEITI